MDNTVRKEKQLKNKPLPQRYVDITKQGLNDSLPLNKASLYEISNNKRDSHQVPVYPYIPVKRSNLAL
jgi:hypothetical protein